MENRIVLYHGSEQIIEEPTFGKGKQNNDFGLGFYCTESEELAKEWASKRAVIWQLWQVQARWA